MTFDPNVILTSLITACIPAFIAYLTASLQSKSRLNELEKSHQADLEKMKLEYELKLKEKESDAQNELVTKMFMGDLDLEHLSSSMEQLGTLNKQAQKLKNSNFIKNQK